MDQVQLISEKARQTWDHFQRVQMQIEEEVGINEETKKYRSDFEDLYFESMAKRKVKRQAVLQLRTRIVQKIVHACPQK